MAKLTLSRKEIEKYIPLTEKNIELITQYGTTVESLNEESIELEIPANRPDLLSLRGVLRSLIPFITKEKVHEYTAKSAKETHTITSNQSVTPLRPVIAAALIEKINLDDARIKEIIAIQEKLHATVGRNRERIGIGIFPADKIVFPLTYTMLPLSQVSITPIGFPKEMTAQHMLQKHPLGKEYGLYATHQKKILVLKDAKDTIISIPPIMNSEHTGRVTKTTKTLLIECSGHNEAVVSTVLTCIVTALIDMGGEAHSLTVVNNKERRTYPNLNWEKRTLNIDTLKKIVGISLTQTEALGLLEKMGYRYVNKTLLIPPWRSDILHEIDIIEDITIAYGYTSLEPTIPKISTLAHESPNAVLNTKMRQVLIGLDMLEISTLYLITPEEAKKAEATMELTVENPRTDFSVLRPHLFVTLLRVLSQNTDCEYPQQLFEIGTVFKKDPDSESGVRESSHLIVGITPGNSTQVKQIIEYLTQVYSLSYSIEETSAPGCIEGRTGSIVVNKKNIGTIAEVHPDMLKSWKLKAPLSFLEINLDQFYESAYPR